MIPALDYEFRIAVFAAGDGNTATQFATHRVGEYVKRILRDKPKTTPVVWRVLSTDDPADQDAAGALASFLNCEPETVAAGDAPAHRKREAVITLSELIVVPWSRGAATHPARIHTVVRAALQQERLVVGVDAQNNNEIYQLTAKHGKHDGEYETIIDRAPLRRPALSRGFVRISAFNRECRFDNGEFQAKVTEKGERLHDAGVAHGVPTEIIALLSEKVVPLAGKADLVATDYGKRYRGLILRLHVLAASSVTIAVLQLVFWPTVPSLTFLEIAALLGIFALLIRARSHHLHDRMMFTRYMAEQLRVAVPALALGYDPAPAGSENDHQRDYYWHADPKVSGSIQRFLKSITQDIAMAYANSQVSAPVAAPINSHAAAHGAAFFEQSLLVPQKDWQNQTAARRHRAALGFEWTTYALFGAAILFATIHLVHGLNHAPAANQMGAGDHVVVVDPAAPHSAAVTLSPLWHWPNWLTVLAILVPAFAGALHGIAHYRDDERVATRAKHMAQRLGVLIEDANVCGSGARLQELIDDTSQVMSAEIYDWLVDSSFRAPEPAV